jgi:membrane complex biogenesis BtpA family protein
MFQITSLLQQKKTVIGMIHFPPLPGAPLYNDGDGMKVILERVSADLVALQEGGIDAVMFCNENDRPYSLDADFSTVSAMSFVIGQVSCDISIPFGIDVLWDPKAAMAIAKATGASFIREVITGSYSSDMGYWNTNVGDLYRYRKLIDAGNVEVLFNISAEFASSADRRPLEEVARSVVFSSLADGILVSGPMTGLPTSRGQLQTVKGAVGDVPVLANTGVKPENVLELMEVADGAIVGTSLKKDGVTWNPVDPVRVREFMKMVNKLK